MVNPMDDARRFAAVAIAPIASCGGQEAGRATCEASYCEAWQQAVA